MRIVGFLILVSLFIGCGNSDKTEGTASTDSIKGIDSVTKVVDTLVVDSADNVEQEIKLTMPATKDFSERLKYFRDQYLVNYTEIEIKDDRIHVLDRHPADKKYKMKLQKKYPVNYGKVENILPVAYIRAYTYKDSASCANALNNWYNCFGNDCNSVVRDEETMIKSTPGYCIINPTSVICLDYPLEHMENNWEPMIKHLKFLLADKGAYFIRIKPHGKLTWEK